MIIVIALLILLVLYGHYIAQYDPIKAVLVVFVSYFILPFLEIKYSTASYMAFLLNVFLVYILAIYTIKKGLYSKIINNPIFKYLLIAHIYLLVIAILKNVYWLNYITEFRRYMNGVIVLIIIMISYTEGEDYSNRIKRMLLYVFVAEFIIAILVYFLPSQISSFFDTTELVGNRVAIRSNLISGTLLSPNHFANIMVIIFFVLLYFSHKNKEINNRTLSIFILMILTAVFLSGVRTALFSLVFGLALYFFRFKRKYGIIVLTVLIFTLATVNVIESSDNFDEVTKSATNPIERMKGANVVFKGLGYISENRITNLWLTIDVLTYFPDNMLFGGNRFYKQGYGLVRYDNKNSTDATLALLLTEHGLLGLVLFLFPFIYILRKLRKKNKDEFYFNLLFFLVLLLQTVSDRGLFLQVPSILYFFISGLQLNAGVDGSAATSKDKILNELIPE
jgi:O-antigen ligase